MPSQYKNFHGLTKLPKYSSLIEDGFCFNQETFNISKSKFTNIYWVEIDKKKISFSLKNQLYLDSLINITSKFQKENRDKRVLCSINTGSFYFSRGLLPKCCAYHLFVKQGQVLQFPNNSRVAVEEFGGKLRILNLKARGEFLISGKKISWIGAGEASTLEGDCRVYGSFNIELQAEKEFEARRLNKKAFFISPGRQELLIGFNLIGGEIKVDYIGKNKLNLFEFLFVVRGKKGIIDKIKVGDFLEGVWIDGQKIESQNLISLSFSLPVKKEILKEKITKELIPKNNIYRPLQKDYRKAWGAILETKEKWIFFINDARPLIENQEGLRISEFLGVLSKKFNFINGAVCDSGQSVKLCVRFKWGFGVFGNLHYLDLSRKIPVWDGIRGRRLPSALVAYSKER